MTVPVLFRDEFLLVCEKPTGIPSESPGLPDLLAEQTGKRVFPVHRLDAGTGGAIILAFTPDACAAMQKAFQSGYVFKEYLAVVSGRIPETSGHYEDLLFHDPKKNKSYVVSRKRAGVRNAVCEWSMCSASAFEEETLSLVRVLLRTGRTHQIRVQFGSRGFPLVGDRKYGSRIKSGTPALWASEIRFSHPRSGEPIIVSSSPPPVFPWTLFDLPLRQ